MKLKFILLSAFLFSSQTYALKWEDLWSTPDQQGQYLMDKGQFKEAKDRFERPDWSAAAAYKAGDYGRAAELLKELKTEQAYYNLGNAQARLGQYEEAIKAYDKALALNPKNQDASYNRRLVQELLKKKQEQRKDSKSKDKQNKDQQGKDQKSKDQQDKDQQSKDQQNKDQQGKGQQSKDQPKDRPDPKKRTKPSQEEKGLSEADREKKQAKEQWLRLIPDDPGGLMREKFLRDHLRRGGAGYL